MKVEQLTILTVVNPAGTIFSDEIDLSNFDGYAIHIKNPSGISYNASVLISSDFAAATPAAREYIDYVSSDQVGLTTSFMYNIQKQYYRYAKLKLSAFVGLGTITVYLTAKGDQ